MTEDNHKITPRDYLELALQPVQGGRKDVAAKNEVLTSNHSSFILLIHKSSIAICNLLYPKGFSGISALFFDQLVVLPYS